jgi:CRP-like cAMP-binding protein
MLDVFKTYLSNRIAISDEGFERIISVAKIKKLRKKQYLLQEGEIWKYNAFILSGLVRVYRVDNQGEEHILNFAKENWWTGDRSSLYSGIPSNLNIDAVEPSEVLLIEKDAFDQISLEIPALNAMAYDIIQKSFIASQERILNSKTFTAEEKYHDFSSRYPDFTVRIPQHMIASFLGISKETLSRVKNQKVKR